MISKRAAGAEFLGTSALLLTVAGSGIMAVNLSGGNSGIALLANSLATGAGLYVLIVMFADHSGAHFNPAVSAAAYRAKEISLAELFSRIAIQTAGAVTGVLTAHLIFGLPLLQVSRNARTGSALFISEVLATFGLVMVIRLSAKRGLIATAASVALYITAAYWFTSSTSFANPAVTLARAFTDTFTGIAPAAVPAFIAAQFLGALLGNETAKLFAATGPGPTERTAAL